MTFDELLKSKRYPLYDERERHRHSEYGRKPQRIVRHRFVTLFLTQTYKELVEKANTNLRKKDTDTAILKRRAYFILDEFGNLPKMENIEGMVTVGRSRGIRYLFVLQSFSQLNAKYGKDIGDIIKTNCNEFVP